jgi:hypothetical protein
MKKACNKKGRAEMTLPLKIVLVKIKNKVLRSGLSYFSEEKKYLIFW